MVLLAISEHHRIPSNCCTRLVSAFSRASSAASSALSLSSLRTMGFRVFFSIFLVSNHRVFSVSTDPGLSFAGASRSYPVLLFQLASQSQTNQSKSLLQVLEKRFLRKYRLCLSGFPAKIPSLSSSGSTSVDFFLNERVLVGFIFFSALRPPPFKYNLNAHMLSEFTCPCRSDIAHKFPSNPPGSCQEAIADTSKARIEKQIYHILTYVD